MYKAREVLLFALLLVVFVAGEDRPKLLSDYNEYQVREPSVFLPIIARNVEHSLPNWLGYIEKLDYPKKRIFVW